MWRRAKRQLFIEKHSKIIVFHPPYHVFASERGTKTGIGESSYHPASKTSYTTLTSFRVSGTLKG